MRQILVGLAGHIDHGKSSLAHRLTGGETDRRPEEQRRGMTVDLGFNHFDEAGWRFVLIDVPGHDRFVHNMVHGVSGVHLGMMVVAADDSVMPQTLEHLEVLDLLGVPGGVIVITKSDLVDADRLLEVRREVSDVVQETTFVDAPVIGVSNLDGKGIPDVRRALVSLAGRLSPQHDRAGPFRLPVDRAFTLTGHGTIVTGTVRLGTIQRGETLMLLPQMKPVRVRQLQSQGEDREAVYAGERAAVNLSGIKVSQVSRGDELVREGTYPLTRRLLISMTVLPRCSRGISHREQVRVHLGTREVTGRIAIANREALPGDQLIAVVDCAQPVLGEFGQPVILRRLSPAETIGGGRVLSVHAKPGNRLSRLWEIGDRLDRNDVDSRVPAILELCGPTHLDRVHWPLEIGFCPEEVRDSISRLAASSEIVNIGSHAGIALSGGEWRRLMESVHRHCRAEADRRHPERWMPRAPIVQRFENQYEQVVTEAAIDELVRTKVLVARDTEIALSEGIRLSKRQWELFTRLEAEIVGGGAAPPMLKELAEQHERSANEIRPLIDLLVEDGRLIRVSDELAVSPGVLDLLQDALEEMFAGQSTITVADARDRWQVTRKHALPYLQYFDEQGYTQRSGTVRIPGPRLRRSSLQDTNS